jgi:nitrite reductase/ring-hydroxylating ferredoxin subunit
MPKYIVGTVDEIRPGARKIVEVAGVSIGVFNLGGNLFALRNRCPHQGGPLCEGHLSGFLVASAPGEYIYRRPGEILRCPWHGWEFDIRTGQSWFDPTQVRVRNYEVAVASGASLLPPEDEEPDVKGMQRGPYLAETYTVSVEHDYVIIDVRSPTQPRKPV